MTPKITLRLGAGTDRLTIQEGDKITSFDRNKLDRSQNSRLRRMTRAALFLGKD